MSDMEITSYPNSKDFDLTKDKNTLGVSKRSPSNYELYIDNGKNQLSFNMSRKEFDIFLGLIKKI